MTGIERKFYKAMMNTYVRAKNEHGFDDTYFLQMLCELGGVATAKTLIAWPDVTERFTKLWELHRLDLSVEVLVLRDEFKELFDDYDRAACRQRIRDYAELIVISDDKMNPYRE